MKTIAVTGITGKSGQYLMRRMMRDAAQLRDYRFLLICRSRPEAVPESAGYRLVSELLRSEVSAELVEADASDPEAMRELFRHRSVDLLLHIAGVTLSGSVVPAAMAEGVNDFILVHTTGIYSRYKAAGEAYRRTEAAISALAEGYRDREIAVTIVRPTMVYGDLQDKNVSTFIRMVDRLRIFPTVNGARYDLQPVWCRDLGEALLDILLRWSVTRGREYILSGGAPLKLIDMFRVIAAQLGVKNRFVSCPFPIAYAGAWAVYLLTLGRMDYREKVQRLVEPRAFPHDAATHDFGFAPVAFEVGVRDEIRMYLEANRR